MLSWTSRWLDGALTEPANQNTLMGSANENAGKSRKVFIR